MATSDDRNRGNLGFWWLGRKKEGGRVLGCALWVARNLRRGECVDESEWRDWNSLSLLPHAAAGSEEREGE